jgi:hypothetical protein
MKKLYYSCFLVLVVSIWYGCSEEKVTNYYEEGGNAPAQISEFAVTSTPGGSIITYKIPDDPNLLYVKAVYEIRPNVFSEAKTSIYNDTLDLVGFGDTNSHEVKIYSVGNNQKISEPVSVTVNPLTPPIKSIFETIELSKTFGGVKVDFENLSQANVSIEVLVDTSSNGTWSPAGIFYTGALEGSYYSRGFESVETNFAVFIRDRWNNKSDTLIKSLTPLYEELIPKNNFRAVILPNDAPGQGPYPLDRVWDGNLGYSGFAGNRSQPMPQWVTIDLGSKVILSRFKLFSFGNEHTYMDGGVKSFEIWGSLQPNPDGSWDSWELLGSFEAFKPSGLPPGQYTAEDFNYAANLGDDFTFDSVDTPTRFIRFKTLEDFGGGGLVTISELTFWGQPVD